MLPKFAICFAEQKKKTRECFFWVSFVLLRRHISDGLVAQTSLCFSDKYIQRKKTHTSIAATFSILSQTGTFPSLQVDELFFQVFWFLKHISIFTNLCISQAFDFFSSNNLLEPFIESFKQSKNRFPFFKIFFLFHWIIRFSSDLCICSVVVLLCIFGITISLKKKTMLETSSIDNLLLATLLATLLDTMHLNPFDQIELIKLSDLKWFTISRPNHLLTLLKLFKVSALCCIVFFYYRSRAPS